MTIPTKTLKNGFTMPVFGLGTWMMGGARHRDPQHDDARDIKTIQTAIALGITHIDSAENYADGFAERNVGTAIRGYDRKKLFLVSKVDPSHLRHNDLLAALGRSLERLQTDYLDLYLIHSPNDAIPLAETMKALDEAVCQGLVKYIGVSNFKTARLQEAKKLTHNTIVVNQVYYNLVAREPEHDGLLVYCQTHDIMLEAYRPVEKGALLSNVLLTAYAKKYTKTPSQVAINWLISQKNAVTLSKMTKKTHMEENLGALGWKLRKEDIEQLRSIFPNQVTRSEDLPLL